MVQYTSEKGIEFIIRNNAQRRLNGGVGSRQNCEGKPAKWRPKAAPEAPIFGGMAPVILVLSA